MGLFIQHLLSQCLVRVRPQQSHVGCSFNVKTNTEAITVKGRWSIRRGNTWLWRDPRLRAWQAQQPGQLPGGGSFQAQPGEMSGSLPREHHSRHKKQSIQTQMCKRCKVISVHIFLQSCPVIKRVGLGASLPWVTLGGLPNLCVWLCMYRMRIKVVFPVGCGSSVISGVWDTNLKPAVWGRH